MTAISEQKMDKGSSTHITDECRSARNKITAARKLYLESIISATKEDINDLDTIDEEPEKEEGEKPQSDSTKEAEESSPEFKQQEEEQKEEEQSKEEPKEEKQEEQQQQEPSDEQSPTEETKTEQQTEEEHKTEETKTEQQSEEEPKTEETKTEQQTEEEPKTEETKTEQQSEEEPKTGSRRNIKCERAELLMILKYYQDHSGDYGSIVDEIIDRTSQLPAKAAKLYNETPKKKLKSRVRNQIYRLFPSKKGNIQDEEISLEIQAVSKMREVASTKVLNSQRETTAASKGTEPSNTTAPLTNDNRDKSVDGATDGLEEEVIDAITKYKYPFENLVLQGGGVKGIAYCGLIKVLEEHGILQQMKRFAGTSAGALTAALLAVGYNSYDAEKVLGVDFKKLVYNSSKLKYLPNLYKDYGLNTGKRLDKFIGDLLALKTGNPDVTFEEVYERFNKELCLVVVNVDTSEEIYCHVKTTPEMPVRLAVRMSVSIPGIFQAVKYKMYKQSYFVDGGLLCNYPIHCFDGWFLSMEMENRFFNKIPSLDDLQEITSFENSFKKDPENKTTIGGMVYCDGENISYRKMLEQSTGVPLRKLPDTVLGNKYAARIYHGSEANKVYKNTIKAVDVFYTVLRENELNNGRIIKNGFMAAFNTPSFTAEYKKLLFGNGCDPETVWVAVNKYGHDEVQFRDITSFIESIGVLMLEAFRDHERKDTSSLLDFVWAMVLGLSENAMQNLFKSTDVERSVGINTWYVQTTTFKLEEEDKQFLTNQGRGSTRKFLQNFLVNNDLERLTEEEMIDIVIPTDISVDKRRLDKIIDL